MLDTEYPSVTGKGAGTEPTQDVIVFVLGGVTAEEAEAVHEVNAAAKAAGSPFNVLLGGTSLLNSRDFLDGLSALSRPPSMDRSGGGLDDLWGSRRVK